MENTVEQVNAAANAATNAMHMAQQAAEAANVAAAANYSTGLGKLFKKPDEYDGKDKSACTDFLAQVRLFIAGNIHLFVNDAAKISFVATYLRGRAFSWIEPYLSRPEDAMMSNFEYFALEMVRALGDPDRTHTMTKRLRALKQTTSCVNFRTEFDSISQYLDINEPGLKTYFYDGLKPEVKDALALVVEEPENFKAFQDLCVRIDNRLYERKQESRGNSNFGKVNNNNHARANMTDSHAARKPAPIYEARPQIYTKNVSMPMTMDIDASVTRKFKPLTPAERQHRITNNLCLYCGKAGHRATECPVKTQRPARIQATLSAPADKSARTVVKKSEN